MVISPWGDSSAGAWSRSADAASAPPGSPLVMDGPQAASASARVRAPAVAAAVRRGVFGRRA